MKKLFLVLALAVPSMGLGLTVSNELVRLVAYGRYRAGIGVTVYCVWEPDEPLKIFYKNEEGEDKEVGYVIPKDYKESFFAIKETKDGEYLGLFVQDDGDFKLILQRRIK